MPSPTTAPNRHRIQRQVLELDLGDGVQGPELQEAMARSFRDHALPELERLFDRVAGPDKLLRLDRLEIDLGTLQGLNWELQFRQRLVEQMTRTLAQSKPASEANGRPRESAEGHVAEPLQQFLFFLAHGRLPWWGGKPGKAWPEALLPHLNGTGWTALYQLLRADPRTRLRLIDHVSDTFLASAAKAFAGGAEVLQVLAALTPLGLTAAAGRQWRRSFWAILLDWVLADGFQSMRGVEFMRDLLQLGDRFGGPAWEGEGPHSHSEAPDRPVGTDDLSPLPQPWRDWLAAAQTSRDASEPESVRQYPRRIGPAPSEESSPPAAPEPSLERGAPARGYPEAPDLAFGVSSTQSLPPSLQRHAGVRSPSPPLQEGEAIYLEGAGAIILHPFLEALFRDRGLLEQRNFRDAVARQRAVHLLGFLGFGREAVPEYGLLLAKLLCGLAFEEPLEPVDLDEDDRTACDALLCAVLGHWTALRSGSPEWLRTQFFLRDGKLEPVDFGWRLTVERCAQDVLLARLPWGLGVIGLPWMEGRIYVRWTE
jgi:hypothetical protein